MSKKNIAIIIGLVVLVLVFYAGSLYGKSSFNKFSVRGNMMGQNGITNGVNSGRNFMQGGRAGGGFVVGEVLSKDSSSLTIKLRDGGSRIVFYVASTTVLKMTNSSINDIAVGSEVSVTGVANSDGSVSAGSIQQIQNR